MKLLIPTAIARSDRPGYYWPAVRVDGETMRRPLGMEVPSLREAVQKARERIAVVYPNAKVAK